MPGRVRSLLAGAVVLLAACSSGDSSATPTPPTSSGSDDATVSTSPPDAGGTTTTAAPDAPPPTPAERPPFEPGPIDWEAFDEEVDVGTLDVPVDYSDPDGPTFELFLAKYNAIDQENRIGTLLVNPGGPGIGGSDFAFFAAQVFDQPLLERFDIVAWDPRGTGESEPAIDCIDDYDRFYTEIDGTPESDEERQLLIETAERFAEACVDRNADIIGFVGTNNSARDIDAIRRALGEDQISYFGFSYGSELGATWVTMFPETVRAAVFDGASDPEADTDGIVLHQQQAFANSLDKFLAECAENEDCDFHNDGDPAAAFDELLERLDAAPIPAQPDRPAVNRDVAIVGVIQAMYDDAYWPVLERSLAAAQQGDGSGLLAFHDAYYRRAPDGTYGNALEAHQVISCADEAQRPSIEDVEAEAAILAEVAPRLNPPGSIGFFCTFLPESLDPRISVGGAEAGPIVVIGTTGDPATPFDSTVRMANALEDGRLVVVDADQHTGYGVSRCAIDIVNAYLIDLEAPDDETECAS